MAAENSGFWSKWGTHYLRSLRSAHAVSTCHNFKDASVQTYPGERGRKLLVDADAAFEKLPTPKPSKTGRAAVQGSMSSAYNNRCNGCVSGDSLAKKADGSAIRADAVRAGDVLVSAAGAPAVVQCVVETRCRGGVADLVAVAPDLRLTPWHPIKFGTAVAWAFPSDLFPERGAPCRALYSFLFEDRAAGYETPSGVAVIALAHGIKDDAVAVHEFFGTERVVAALATLPGFARGRVVLGDGAFLRLDARVVAVDSARVVVPPVVRA